MQKISPYIFPLIITAIVFFLVYRWFESRGEVETLEYGEGIEIENLSESEAADILGGVGDLASTPLEAPEDPEPGQTPGTGSIRYEISEDRVRFSVSAGLSAEDEPYRVWIRTVDQANLTEAFVLTEGKAGYMGTAAVSADLLPLEVIVSAATSEADVFDQVILKGIIEAAQLTEEDAETEEAAETEENAEVEGGQE
ncbi:MAG: hypothetical protein WDZ94_02650 [Patescibacteria group bacterium]